MEPIERSVRLYLEELDREEAEQVVASIHPIRPHEVYGVDQFGRVWVSEFGFDRDCTILMLAPC